jgi:glucose/mannose-6-phosphate isomerase
MASRGEVLALPDHLEDALWRVESARLEPISSAGLLACGSGAAETGARLALEALGGRLSGPLEAVSDGRVEESAATGRVVLCSSFSGEEEGAIACFDAAGSAAGRVVAATGGPLVDRAREEGAPVIGLPAIIEPDAALGYFFVVTAEVAAIAGVAPRIGAEIEAAAASLREHSEQIAAGTMPALAAESETARVLAGAMRRGLETAG